MDPPDDIHETINTTQHTMPLPMIPTGGRPMMKHQSTGSSSTGSILKVKNDVPVEPSQSSLLAIAEARRYQEVEKGYKERKAKKAAEGWSSEDSAYYDSGETSKVSAAKEDDNRHPSKQPPLTTATGTPSGEIGEWEFTAPPRSDGCCVIT